jgi:hypothetical protein
LPLHPSLTRALVDRAAGLPGEVRRLLDRIANDLVLGPHGFTLPGELPPDAIDPTATLAPLPDPVPQQLERLAHLDAEVSLDLWAACCDISRDALLPVVQDLHARGICELALGVARLDPPLRQALREQAKERGTDQEHHLTIARVLEHHDALPHRRGRAWIEAGDLPRGVGVWLDHWRRLVALQGFDAVEGMLREAEQLLVDHPPSPALQGRLATVLALVRDRGYASSPPEEALARPDLALAIGWWDPAAEDAYYAILSTPSGPARKPWIDESLEALRGRCADGPWARLLTIACLSSRRWGLEPDGPLVAEAWRAIAAAEASRDCGDAALVTPALIGRLRPLLEGVLAEHQGDLEATAIAFQQVAQLSRAHDAETLVADLHDLARIHGLLGNVAAAEVAYAEIERGARWTGAIGVEASIVGQRAGLAVLTQDWDRAARLARRAQLGVPPGYPLAMMRLIGTMHMVDEGRPEPAVAVVNESLDDLTSIRPADLELVHCIAHLLQAMATSAMDVPAPWIPLLELVEASAS